MTPMSIDQAVLDAFARVAVAGALGGLIGGFLAARRSNLLGAVLLGVIGGIVAAAITGGMGAPPIVEAGQGFSLLYGFIGGFLLGLVVGASGG